MSARTGGLQFGVSTPGGPLAVDELEAVAAAIERRPTLVLFYADFVSAPPIAELDAIVEWGAVPIITWEPWLWRRRDRHGESTLTLQAIAAGAHDEYLSRWAVELSDWGRTVYLRFAHEFNGTWYPWTPAGGTDAGDYVAAWRHAHDIFGAASADNVTWVWSPSVVLPGSAALDEWYPGDEFVDLVGADGYNWGTAGQRSRWVGPDELFGATLAELRATCPDTPILVAEVGCAEEGGSKPRWIEDLVRYLTGQPDVVGFVWFDHDKEVDWRLASTSEAAAAMAKVLT